MDQFVSHSRENLSYITSNSDIAPQFSGFEETKNPIINLLLKMNLHAYDLSVWQKSIYMQLITV